MASLALSSWPCPVPPHRPLAAGTPTVLVGSCPVTNAPSGVLLTVTGPACPTIVVRERGGRAQRLSPDSQRWVAGTGQSRGVLA